MNFFEEYQETFVDIFTPSDMRTPVLLLNKPTWFGLSIPKTKLQILQEPTIYSATPGAHKLNLRYSWS